MAVSKSEDVLDPCHPHAYLDEAPRKIHELVKEFDSLPPWLTTGDSSFLYYGGHPDEVRSLLILDGHPSRNVPAIWKLCQQEKLDVLILPARASQLLEPLDQFFNVLFKRLLRQAKYRRKLEADGSNLFDFLDRIKEAIIKSHSLSSIKQSFKKCGIIPFCPALVLSQLPPKCPDAFLPRKPKPARWTLSGSKITDPDILSELEARSKVIDEEMELREVEDEQREEKWKEVCIISNGWG
jgi:hypothetical protein